MAQVKNDVPEILTNVATLTIEYTQISDAFDADVELAKRAFKKKYQACVQAEMSCLEGTGGDISDFTTQVSLLKAENTQTMGLLRGKQSKISKDLRNKLGEFDHDAIEAANKARQTMSNKSNKLQSIIQGIETTMPKINAGWASMPTGQANVWQMLKSEIAKLQELHKSLQ